MYCTGRYFTVTGEIYQGRNQIQECTAAIAGMHRKYIGQQDVHERASASPAAAPAPVTLSDDEIIRKASEASNGALFRQLGAEIGRAPVIRHSQKQTWPL